MLKLEKSKKNSEIHVRMRRPTRIFDRYFLFALSTAVAIHLLGAVLFNVKLFTLGETGPILPASKVFTQFIKSSISENDAIVTTSINLEGRLTSAQLAPIPSSPSLKPLPPVQLTHSYHSIEKLQTHPFLEIEKIAEENHFSHLEIPILAPSIKIAVAGPLAEIPLQDFDDEFKNLFQLASFSPQNLRQQRIVYAVQVDANTGLIYWFQSDDNVLDKSQVAVAEKLLKNMQFQTNSQDFVQNGYVEITFTSGNRSV